MKMTAEESILRRIGVDFLSPAPGCCGMAGSFGFEHDKYDLSMAIGELELLPAVRRAPSDWLIVADGFSCREQIAQGSDRHALHVAEVLQMATNAGAAKEKGNGSPRGEYPESREIQRHNGEIRRSMKRAGLRLGAVAGGAILFQSLS